MEVEVPLEELGCLALLETASLLVISPLLSVLATVSSLRGSFVLGSRSDLALLTPPKVRRGSEAPVCHPETHGAVARREDVGGDGPDLGGKRRRVTVASTTNYDVPTLREFDER